MSIQRYLHGRSYATDCTCERGLRPAAAKCICLRLAHVRPYKTAHYSRVMPRTHVAASFFFSSTLCELPLKASRRPFLHASFLSSLSSFPRCPLLFSCFFAFLSSSTSFLSSPFFFSFFFSRIFTFRFSVVASAPKGRATRANAPSSSSPPTRPLIDAFIVC